MRILIGRERVHPLHIIIARSNMMLLNTVGEIEKAEPKLKYRAPHANRSGEEIWKRKK